MSMKPLKLFSHSGGPNPWKVIIVLEELGLPYECEYPEMSTLHTPSYEKYNPNGRVPAIVDPNNDDFTLWESGAIIEYLVSKYDPSEKLHTESGNDRYLQQQFLHFQMSGQGPYFGQAVWFTVYHPEKYPSAIERYTKEIKRVIGVLDQVLQGKEYLVGNKISYADLAFLPWFWISGAGIPGFQQVWEEGVEGRDSFKAWFDRLMARDKVSKAYADRAKQREAAK